MRCWLIIFQSLLWSQQPSFVIHTAFMLELLRYIYPNLTWNDKFNWSVSDFSYLAQISDTVQGFYPCCFPLISYCFPGKVTWPHMNQYLANSLVLRNKTAIKAHSQSCPCGHRHSHTSNTSGNIGKSSPTLARLNHRESPQLLHRRDNRNSSFHSNKNSPNHRANHTKHNSFSSSNDGLSLAVFSLSSLPSSNDGKSFLLVFSRIKVAFHAYQYHAYVILTYM